MTTPDDVKAAAAEAEMETVRNAFAQRLEAAEAEVERLTKERDAARKRVTEMSIDWLQDLFDDIAKDEEKPDEERLHLRDFLMPQLVQLQKAIDNHAARTALENKP